MKKIFITAGDPSGDLHGANLAKRLTELSGKIAVYSAAGKNLAKHSTQIIDLTQIAVTGIFEVLSYLPKIIRYFNIIISKIEKIKPDVVILIDFPDFNLRLAKKIKKKGFKVFYYISPQIWAWRRNRINIIKRFVDKMLVIFPFEESFYRHNGIDALYVGHPLLEIKEFTEQKKHAEGTGQKTVALLPGSRPKEIKKHLPLLLKTTRLLRKEKINFILVKHPGITAELFKEAYTCNIAVIDNIENPAIAYVDAAISSSGTATLELALKKIPAVVIYKTGFLSWMILKNIVKTDYISIVNILAKDRIFPELIQYKATPENIAGQLMPFLTDGNLYSKTRHQLDRIRGILENKPAADTAARVILKDIEN